MAGNVPDRAGRGGETHMNMRDEVVVILAAIVTGALFWALCGKTAWLIGHDDGQAYERYMESMMENGMCPDIYGYGWGR